MITCKIVGKIYVGNNLKYYKLKVKNENNYGLFEPQYIQRAIEAKEMNVTNIDVEKNIKDTAILYNKIKHLGILSPEKYKVIDLEDGRYIIKCNDLYIFYISNACTEVNDGDFELYFKIKNKGIDADHIKNLKVVGGNNLTTVRGLFASFEWLERLDLHNFVTEKVTDMSFMFQGMHNLKTIDTSNFCTENVNTMYCMFGSCESIEELDLRDFDTGNVTNMNSMFNCCKNLKNISLDTFDTSKVTIMEGMFFGCEDLRTLDLSSFNVENVTNMVNMFNCCSHLSDLKFDYELGIMTKSGEYIDRSGMFVHCTNLEQKR